jgi:hypothetical protein
MYPYISSTSTFTIIVSYKYVCSASSVNQPQLCPSTTWYTNGITIANVSNVGVEPYGVFVSINNTLYTADRADSLFQVWLQGSLTPNKTISAGLSYPYSIFVTYSGDIYVDNGASNGRVDKWSVNANNSVPFMTVSSECYSIFIDLSDNLYCAVTFSHQISKKWFYDNATASVMIAGTGGSGSAAYQLTWPAGVFVDVNFNLYVGDCGNNRIQMFALGQSNAITVVGNGAPGTITLNCPNAVALDANGYLFIGDTSNNRLIGSGPYGFRCLFGCTTTAGSASNQLYYPRAFSFDIYGNLYVVDEANSRIQKFILASNSCSKYNFLKICIQ